MKIAISTKGDRLDSPLDDRFGRAQKFIIYNTEKENYEVIDNSQLNASHGAGVQTAQNLAKMNVDVIISGNCGPKAMQILQASDIIIYKSVADTVENAINQLREGKLHEMQSASVNSHFQF